MSATCTKQQQSSACQFKARPFKAPGQTLTLAPTPKVNAFVNEIQDSSVTLVIQSASNSIPIVTRQSQNSILVEKIDISLFSLVDNNPITSIDFAITETINAPANLWGPVPPNLATVLHTAPALVVQQIHNGVGTPLLITPTSASYTLGIIRVHYDGLVGVTLQTGDQISIQGAILFFW